MIMSKKIIEHGSKSGIGRNEAATQNPASGIYRLTVVDTMDDLNRAITWGEADYAIIGSVVSVEKAAMMSRTIRGENGKMTQPVVLLKKSGLISAAESARPEAAVAEPQFPVPFPLREEVKPEIRIRDIEIIPGRHEVRVRGKKVTLTFSEFRILYTLATHPGWVYDRARIIREVHGDDYNCTDRAVDVQVTGLRKKLGTAGNYIQTVRGVGYRFID